MSEHLGEEQLHAFVDGELETGSRAGVQSHLDDCAHCRQSLASIRLLFERLESVEDLPLTVDVSARVVEQLRARAEERPGLRRLVLVEVLLAGILLGLVGLTESGARIFGGVRIAAMGWPVWRQAIVGALQSVLAEMIRSAELLWSGWLTKWTALSIPEAIPEAPWPQLLGLMFALALFANGLLLRERGAAGRAPGNLRNGANHG